MNGKLSAQKAMDNIAKAQDRLMASLKLSQYSPQLNPLKSRDFWLNQPGAPKPARPRERPKTVEYQDIIQRWAKVRQK